MGRRSPWFQVHPDAPQACKGSRADHLCDERGQALGLGGFCKWFKRQIVVDIAVVRAYAYVTWNVCFVMSWASCSLYLWSLALGLLIRADTGVLRNK